jgi:hypothetical protein
VGRKRKKVRWIIEEGKKEVDRDRKKLKKGKKIRKL